MKTADLYNFTSGPTPTFDPARLSEPDQKPGKSRRVFLLDFDYQPTMTKTEPQKLELERLVFFSDAVVAIAITLLALELRIGPTPDGHLHFQDFVRQKETFAAFFLSFFSIAVFWKIHHEFYRFISRVDDTLLWYNIAWLLFIVLLPFTTSLISSYFNDPAAMSCYCANTFLITLFQNQIWDYVAKRPAFMKPGLDEKTNASNRIACNIAMLNGLVATLISFASPFAAFLLLLFRFPAILLLTPLFRHRHARR